MRRSAYRSRRSYAQVDWDMVEILGGDITMAVVFDWIAWKSDPEYATETDADGNTWYAAALPALAATMRTSEKVVRRALDELVKRGHLQTTQLHKGGAYDRTKAYRPVWDDDTTPEKASAPEGRSTCPDGQITSAPEGRSHLPLRADLSTLRTVEEPTEQELSLIAIDELEPPAPEQTVDQQFDKFWAAWPRKVDRKDALAAFGRALKKTTLDVLVAAATRFAAEQRATGTEPKFIPHAATWLNAERWLDEPDTGSPPGPPQRHKAVANALALVDHFAALEAQNEPHRDLEAPGSRDHH